MPERGPVDDGAGFTGGVAWGMFDLGRFGLSGPPVGRNGHSAVEAGRPR